MSLRQFGSRFVCVLAVYAAVFAATARGNDVHWNVPSGDFNTGGNWDTTNIPNGGDNGSESANGSCS